jgi:CelD/BcsL family acetyltransferase involved in cellulose biosynthesis
VLTVVECASLPELEALRPEWDDLVNRAANPSVFSTWEWVEACWRFAAPGKRPLVLVARHAHGSLAGLLPLARTTRFGVLGMLEGIGCNKRGYPAGDYGGLVASHGAEHAIWSAMLRYLRKSVRWSLIDLRNVPQMQNAERGMRNDELPTPEQFRIPNSAFRIRMAEVCRVVPLAVTFEEYLGGLSSNARQNIRRKLRKLEAAGHSIEQVDAHDATARDAAMQALFEFHQARWEQDASGGIFREERDRRMHMHLAARMAARGWLDLRVVRSKDGDIAGVVYNFRIGGAGYYYAMGLDPSEPWPSYSLGVCLLADSIAAASAAGCHTFDLLRGDHEYKRHFGGYLKSNLRVTIYRYGWLPRAEVAARKLRGLLSRQAGNLQPNIAAATGGAEQ